MLASLKPVSTHGRLTRRARRRSELLYCGAARRWKPLLLPLLFFGVGIGLLRAFFTDRNVSGNSAHNNAGLDVVGEICPPAVLDPMGACDETAPAPIQAIVQSHAFQSFTTNCASCNPGVAVKPTCVNRAAVAALRRHLQPRFIHVVTATARQCAVFDSWGEEVTCHLQASGALSGDADCVPELLTP